MKEIQISKFKTTCLAVIAEIKKTGEPVRVTRRGKAMVEIVAVAELGNARSLLGSWRGRGEILGDLVAPALEESEFDG